MAEAAVVSPRNADAFQTVILTAPFLETLGLHSPSAVGWSVTASTFEDNWVNSVKSPRGRGRGRDYQQFYPSLEAEK